MREIRAGRFAEQEFLPTESELMRAYGVSRNTVRSAIQDLKQRGVVSTRQGSGSKIISVSGTAEFVEAIQSIDELIAFGQETRRVLVGHEIVMADQAIAELFGCAPGRRIAKARMLRKTIATPAHTIAVVSLYLDAILEPVIHDLPQLEKSAAEIIRDRYGYETGSVTQTIQACLVDPESAKALAIKPNDAALLVTRAYAATRDSAPFLVARSLCRADKFRIVSRFTSRN